MVQYTYSEVIPYGFETQYVLISNFNQSTLISNSPNRITAIYDQQLTTNFFIMIIMIPIIALLVSVPIILRKKKII